MTYYAVVYTEGTMKNFQFLCKNKKELENRVHYKYKPVITKLKTTKYIKELYEEENKTKTLTISLNYNGVDYTRYISLE